MQEVVVLWQCWYSGEWWSNASGIVPCTEQEEQEWEKACEEAEQETPVLAAAAHASATGAVYVQPAVPVQDDASPAVKLHVGAVHASVTGAV